MQYRSRQYDSSYGRFLQQDSYEGDELTPPSLHRYVYVHNNPGRYADPTGHAISWGVAIATAMIAGLMFFVMAVILRIVFLLAVRCLGDWGCAEAALHATLHHFEYIPLIGAIYLISDLIVNEGVGPLEISLILLVYGLIIKTWLIEMVVRPELEKIKNPLIEGGTTIGIIFAIQYSWVKFLHWLVDTQKEEYGTIPRNSFP
jgi:hypothetical protein